MSPSLFCVLFICLAAASPPLLCCAALCSCTALHRLPLDPSPSLLCPSSPAPALRRREKAERREQLKKEGKLLTGKAKEEAERRARAAQQFLQQAGLSLDECELGQWGLLL